MLIDYKFYELTDIVLIDWTKTKQHFAQRDMLFIKFMFCKFCFLSRSQEKILEKFLQVCAGLVLNSFSMAEWLSNAENVEKYVDEQFLKFGEK